jgi:DNA-binding MurR/RpiR family transcriptional regulator
MQSDLVDQSDFLLDQSVFITEQDCVVGIAFCRRLVCMFEESVQSRSGHAIVVRHHSFHRVSQLFWTALIVRLIELNSL